MIKLWSLIIVGVMVFTDATPYRACPEWMKTSGIVNDIGLLADAVSWDNNRNVIGVCDEYKIIHEAEGIYDTRMRIYQSLRFNRTFISFRPTQQNKEAEKIHEGRKMVDCSFVVNCIGKVNDRFQEAFVSLVSTIKDWGFLNGNDIYTIGHSLGGSLQLFMGLFIWLTFAINPKMSIGLAGPFIGDLAFSDYYLDAYFYLLNHNWWQVETVDVNNLANFDGTVEQYQTANNDIFIEQEALCAFPIQPLTIPTEAYGMHDIKQYRLDMNGENCAI